MKLQQWDNKKQIILKGKMIKSMLNSPPNMEKMTQKMQLQKILKIRKENLHHIFNKYNYSHKSNVKHNINLQNHCILNFTII